MDFVSLHTHSTFSYGDGFGMPEDHMARAAELGIPAVAFTEHGNMSSVVKAAQAGARHGVKPIFGLEAYTGPTDMRETKNQRKWHQTILAENQAGYGNLMQLVARSWSEEGFYRWPTVTAKMLGQHAEGLIVTSGCADSLLACTLLGGKGIERGSVQAAERVLKSYRAMFGDRYYLEVQRFPQLQRAHHLNAQYERWSREFGIPLVATADVHYPFPRDNEMQKVLHAASRNTGTVEAAEASWEYGILLTYPESDFEVFEHLCGTGLSNTAARQAIDNTGLIADRCNVELPVMDRLVYPFEADGAPDEITLLRRWLNEGWAYRGMRGTEARRRVEFELDQIVAKGFVSYFLMIADIVRWAKRQGIAVGPGRGSGAASLVLYLLRVSEVNPMGFPLMLFERFIAPDRDDLPDVDIDFESERRDEVRQYAVGKYGVEMVGNVGTLTYYRGKNSVQTVGRVYEVPFTVCKSVSDMIVDSDDGDQVSKTRELFPVVEEVFQEWPQLALAERLEGNVVGFGVHAAGLVVGTEPLHRYTTTYEKHGVGKSKKTVQVLSVDKYDGETLGLLKIDALGLKTMSIISTAAQMIGMTMDEVYRIPLDDPEVMAGFRAGALGGVFQFEGSTTHDICVEIQPREFMDLAHITSLSRPGPLHGGSTADFIRARHGEGQRDAYPAAIESVLASTEGEIVYQEQVIMLARSVGGFDAAGASKVRSIISKKKGQAAFAELYDEFLEGATERGVEAEVAAAVWRKMVTSGAYSFNVAHAVSYSVLSVWCMWFRVHHPLAYFYGRLMANVDASKDPKTKVHPTETILKDMAATTDIKVLPLDPGLSRTDWSVEDGALRPGFRQVPTIGADKGQAIEAWRAQQGESKSLGGFLVEWEDLTAVSGVGPTTVDKLREFAEDPDPFGTGRIGRNIKAIVDWLPESGDDSMVAPTKMSTDIPYAAGEWGGVLLGLVHEVQHKDLYESHRNRTGKVLDPADVNEPHLSRSVSLYCEDTRGRFKVNVSRFSMPKYEAEINRITPGRTYVLAAVGKSRFPGKTTFCNQMWAIEPDDEE